MGSDGSICGRCAFWGCVAEWAVDQYNPGFDLVPNRHDAVREVFPYGAGGASVRSSASSMGNGTS